MLKVMYFEGFFLKNKNIEKRKKKEKFIRMVDIMKLFVSLIWKQRWWGVVSLSGINQRWYSSLTEDYIYN